MARRRYIVVFKWGTEYQNKFVCRVGRNKDEVFANACNEFGFYNVSKVYMDDEFTHKWLHVHRFTELREEA